MLINPDKIIMYKGFTFSFINIKVSPKQIIPLISSLENVVLNILIVAINIKATVAGYIPSNIFFITLFSNPMHFINTDKINICGLIAARVAIALHLKH